MFSINTFQKRTTLKSIFTLFIVFVFIFRCAGGVSDPSDSLFTISRVNKIDSLMQEAKSYRSIDSWESLSLAKKANYLSESIHIDSLLIKSQVMVAQGYYLVGYQDSCQLIIDHLLKKDRLDVLDKYDLLSLAGLSNRKLNDFENAVNYQLKAVELSDSLQSIDLQMRSNHNLALSYFSLGLYEKAIRRNEIASEKAKSLENYAAATSILEVMGGLHAHLRDSIKSYEYYSEALQLLEKHNPHHLRIKASILMSLGHTLVTMDRIAEAIQKYESSIQLAKSINNDLILVNNYIGISNAYKTLAEKTKEQEYVDACVFYGRKLIEVWSDQEETIMTENVYEMMAQMLFLQENYKEAYEYLDKLKMYREKNNDTELSKSVAELETKLDVAEKETKLIIQNAELRQSETERNTLLAVVVFLGIISLLIFRSQRIKSKTNQQLKEAEALKNRWLANVSHELKTPLTLVQAPLTKVLDSTKLNEIDRGNLKVANRSVKQLKRLVSEILDLSKLDKGHLELHPAITDYADLVRVTSYAFESLAISRGTQLKVQTKASRWMYIDEHQIRKTIENLLTNALKFTKEDDTITVGLTVENEAVQLTVTDTGMGISEEDLPHIFDRFYQAQDPAKSRIGGTGIGLSLTKEIIELHEGAITVESQEGRETTFAISLPTSLLREAPEEKASPKENTNESHSVLDSGYQEIITELPRLLLVEDNDDMRNFLINDLKTDYTITKALDGKDALDKLSGTTYDVIISDIMMPRMDGMTLIHEVKKNPDWKKIPLIVLTALDGEEDRLSVLRAGVDDYITKPFNSEELKVRLQNLINNSKSRSDTEGIEEEEDSLLASIEKDIKMHLADLDYTVKAMADNVSMTERSLHRYLKKTTGLSPTGLITELKLQKAMQLLEKKSFRTLKEICSEVGYERTSRFSTAFEKRFGKRPADYL